MSDKVIVTTGRLGWGNRKSGVEAYGPAGRWAGPAELPNRSNANVVYGDLLGDHLEELGAHEGAHLVVIAITSRFDHAEAESLQAKIERLVSADSAEVDADRLARAVSRVAAKWWDARGLDNAVQAEKFAAEVVARMGQS